MGRGTRQALFPHFGAKCRPRHFAIFSILTPGAGVTPAEEVWNHRGSTLNVIFSYAPLALFRTGSSLDASADFSTQRRFNSANASSTNAFISATSGITRGSAIIPKYKLL